MSSLFTGLLFMHGHIADIELARRLAEVPKRDNRPTGKRQRAAEGVKDTPQKPRPIGALAHGGCG